MVRDVGEIREEISEREDIRVQVEGEPSSKAWGTSLMREGDGLLRARLVESGLWNLEQSEGH